MEKCYATDLSDEEWESLKLHLPAPNKLGRPRTHGTRAILNAVFYILKSGCPWRLLPKDFPPWETVYWWFARWWRADGTFERLNAALRERLRVRLGVGPYSRARASPTPRLPRRAGLVASRGATTATRRFGAGKGTCPRGHGWPGLEGQGAQRQGPRPGWTEALLLESARGRLERLKHLWVDAGYEGRGKRWAEEAMGLSVEIVRKPPKPPP